MLEESILDNDHAVFAVADRPLCVWDDELREHNLAFCNSINPDWFFDSVAHHLEGDLESIQDLEPAAALSVRLAYHHALETFFALLFAGLQAPFCVPAWLDLYDIKDLCGLIERINYQNVVLNAWEYPRPTWEQLARTFNSAWINKPNGDATIAGIGNAWSRLAQELCDETVRAEYNSVKHGFRARSGGFALRAGIEETPGVAAPDEAMKSLGGSKHGWSTLVLAPIPSGAKKRKAVHFSVEKRSGNWLVEPTIGKLQILTVSMINVIGTIRSRNGIPAETIQFHRFEEVEDYEKPWRQSPGITSMSFAIGNPDERVSEIPVDVLRRRMEQASGLANDNSGPL